MTTNTIIVNFIYIENKNEFVLKDHISNISNKLLVDVDNITKFDKSIQTTNPAMAGAMVIKKINKIINSEFFNEDKELISNKTISIFYIIKKLTPDTISTIDLFFNKFFSGELQYNIYSDIPNIENNLLTNNYSLTDLANVTKRNIQQE